MNPRKQRQLTLLSCGAVIGIAAAAGAIAMGGRIAGAGMILIGLVLLLSWREVGPALRGFSYPRGSGVTTRLASAVALVGGICLIGYGVGRLLAL